MAAARRKKRTSIPARVRSTTPPKRRSPGGKAGIEDGQSHPFRLKDEVIQKALETGEHRAELEIYFGKEQYDELVALAKQTRTRGLRGGERVLILPGIMGSKLGRKRKFLWDDVIWLDPLDVIPGNLKQLKLAAGDRISPLGVLLFTYLKLKLSLRGEGFDAEFHPYDWRRSTVELARELQQRIATEPSSRVHLVAHSMGGLVARAAIKMGTPKLGRLVMLGTPNYGSFQPAQLVRGVYSILKGLAAIDLGDSAEKLARDVFNDFPSIYELMPAPGKSTTLELLDPAAWPKKGLRPNLVQLAAARGLQSALAPADDRFFLIAGVNQSTVTGLKRTDEEFEYLTSNAGDGTVPLDFCRLPGATTYYVESSHGSLPNNQSVRKAVGEILRDGQTSALPTEAPSQRSMAGSRSVPVTTTDSSLRAGEPSRSSNARAARRRVRPGPEEARSVLAEIASPATGVDAVLPLREVDTRFRDLVVGRRNQHRIDVNIALGSITEVNSRACVLGIFRDVAPQGAALAMDARLDGAITEITNRRMFSANVGEVFILPTARHQVRTDFVLFAGLGDFGTFDLSVLETVADNVMRTLISTQVSELATVLIGGSSGSEIAPALRSIVVGFVKALLDCDNEHMFRRITLVERDPARFEAMKSELWRLAATDLFESVEITITESVLPQPALMPPSRAIAAPSSAEPVYLTVTARQDPAVGQGGFVFTSSLLDTTSKATVLVGEAKATERDIREIQGEIESEKLKFGNVGQLGERIASTFLSKDVAQALAAIPAHHPVVLVHDAIASRLPWETLSLGGSFIAKDRGLHRRYLASNMSVTKWLEERRKDAVINVLLVANPTENLDGAEEEAERLISLFAGKDRIRITARRKSDATRPRLIEDFQSGRFDVIHYAGHAYFDSQSPSRSGILCAGDEILSGADLAKLSNLPGLVFFNACEAGRLRGMAKSMTAASMPSKASAAKAARAKDAKFKPGTSSSLDKTVSFAEAFLRGGVANYIGTYWSVGDASAKTFAGTLYSRLIAGDTVGDALLAARREVFDKLKNLDWADYIHYGNQSFALKDTGGGA